jgi:membrane associated rhomboid family serine protease
MAQNVVLVIATVVVSYLLGHVIAVRKARRDGWPEPALFDYAGHRALWSVGNDYRRDPWYWVILMIAIVIVVTLTKRASFGVGFAAAAAAGFIGGALYRRISSRVDRSTD